jgi:hypothetical protein
MRFRNSADYFGPNHGHQAKGQCLRRFSRGLRAIVGETFTVFS